MSDAPTQRLPENRPPGPGGGTGLSKGTDASGRGKVWLIVSASVLGLAIIALVIVLLVRSSGAASPGPTQTPIPSSASPTPSTTASPTPTQTTAPPVTSCVAASLAITLGTPDGAAGSTYLPIVFANSGAQPCTLTGYPVVSFVDSSGATIGAAATPDTSQADNAITVAPGSSATAVLTITSASNVDNCDPKDASGLRVRAPDVSTAVTLDASGYTACANGAVNILSIAPVATG